jgi:hypothetical protein
MCYLCSGLLTFLGSLGSLTWYRCRSCGAEVSLPHDDNSLDTDE